MEKGLRDETLSPRRLSRNLTGRRFGKLVAIKFLGLRPTTTQNVAWWLCQCDCGNRCEASAHHLLAKHYPKVHCGCVARPGRKAQLPEYDLTGKTFGELTVLAYGGTDKIGNHTWNCRCTCGELCTASTCALQRGAKRSCGHLYSVKNRIFVLDDVSVCLINGGKDYFWFETADIDLVENYQWNVQNGYAYTHYGNTTYRLIRMLMGLPPSSKRPFVDHINGDTRDNRRSNLRLCSVAENVRHKHGVKGYYLDKKSGRYFSRIKVDGKIIHLGMFDTTDEARAAYLEASKNYHGDFGTYQKIIWFPGYTNE